MTTPLIKPREVIDFWLGQAASNPIAAKARTMLWYGNSPEVDEQIRKQFAETLAMAERNELDDWRDSSEGTLALVILLDQFARNLYRGTGDAFKNDAKALEIAESAVDQGLHQALPWIGRAFLYHPFHHAESLEAQNKSVALFENLCRDAPPDWSEQLNSYLDYATGHRDIIRRFGRFPHRNQALGRANTKEEEDYLENARTYGQ